MRWPLPIRTPECVGLKVHQSSETRWLFPVAWQRRRNFRGQPLTTGPLGAEPEYVPKHSSAPSTHSVSVSLHRVHVHAQVTDLHITHTSLQGQQMDCCVQIWHSMGCPCVCMCVCAHVWQDRRRRCLSVSNNTATELNVWDTVLLYGDRINCKRMMRSIKDVN